MNLRKEHAFRLGNYILVIENLRYHYHEEDITKKKWWPFSPFRWLAKKTPGITETQFGIEFSKTHAFKQFNSWSISSWSSSIKKNNISKKNNAKFREHKGKANVFKVTCVFSIYEITISWIRNRIALWSRNDRYTFVTVFKLYVPKYPDF